MRYFTAILYPVVCCAISTIPDLYQCFWLLPARVLRPLASWFRPILVAFLLLPFANRAQTMRPDGMLDSLKQRLHTPALADTDRVLTLEALSWYYMQSDFALSRRYGQQSLREARRTGYVKGEIKALYQLGNVAVNLQDNLEGIRCYQLAVQLASRAPASMVKYRLAALSGLADVAMNQKSYAEARRYYLQSLALSREHAASIPSHLIENAHSGLMSLYLNQLSAGDQTDSIVALTEYWAKRALPLARQDQNPSHIGLNLIALALVQERHHYPDSTRILLRQALALQKVEDAPADAANILYATAEFEQRQGNNAVAIATGQRILRLARAMQDPTLEADISEVLGKAYAGLGQGIPAYRASATANRLRDSIITADNQAAISRLQVQFDTERKESRIRELTQTQKLQAAETVRQHQRLWLLAAVLVAVLAGLATATTLALRLRRSRALLARQNEVLAQTRATQDRLYSIIAHDLRGPLFSFTRLADIVDYYRQRGELDALDELTQEVRHTARGLTGLLDNLLHWAASETGELTPNIQSLPVANLLKEVLDLYAPAARAKQIDLQLTEPDAALTVLADRNMTRTILRNLVGNALNVLPAGASIYLTANPEARQVRLSIRDTGPGLTPAQVQGILATAAGGPVQAGLPGARREGGTGLGLPLVQRLSALQHGRFAFESVPGQGTTASLTLPVAPDMLAEAA